MRFRVAGRMLGRTVNGQRVWYGGPDPAPPPNTGPTATFTSVADDLSVTTDATASSDTDGTIVSYAWSWGDTATSTGVTAAHTYATAGDYTITLTVTDDQGATDTHAETLTVTAPPPENVAPVASFTSTVTNLAVTVTSTSTDSDGTITTTAWDFGDGATATGTPATHQYAAAGTYTVTLTVTDDDGATDTETAQVTVAGAPQTITLVTNGITGLAAGTTSVSASYVGGAATDVILGLLGAKPYNVTPTNAGYTVLNEITTGTVAPGPSSGSVLCSVHRRNSSPTTGSSNTFTVTNGTVATVRTARFATSVGTWASVTAFGMTDTDPTGTTIAATGNPAAGTIQAGDMLVVHAISTEDSANHDARSLTVAGCILGTPTWLTKASTTTGDDMSTFTGYVHVLSGSSTGPVTYSATAASGTAVEVVVLRD